MWQTNDRNEYTKCRYGPDEDVDIGTCFHQTDEPKCEYGAFLEDVFDQGGNAIRVPFRLQRGVRGAHRVTNASFKRSRLRKLFFGIHPTVPVAVFRLKEGRIHVGTK